MVIKWIWVDICETCLNWGVIVMSLIAKTKQIMHKLGVSSESFIRKF